ncbi:MAG: fibrinogen-like YCDxxxxGGGW domain-containing protein [Candidatus Aureabacteria bacterium]|nr:fibrinogen-like YCDxxxxGGGW domain-containing protein [Candidatus Auribacterota bacterium]
MKRMTVITLSVIFAAALCGMVVAGSVDSPGAPSAGSGMYSLSQIYDYLNSGIEATPVPSFQEPLAAPGPTMKTTKEIYDTLHGILSQSNVTAAHVEAGWTFFCTQPGSWGVQTGTGLMQPTPTPTPTITPTITPYGVYASCKAIKTATPAAGDGTYTIDPDGSGAATPFPVYCDMTTNGGGWTLVLTRCNSTQYDAADFNTIFGTNLTDPTANADNVYKGVWSNLGFNIVKYELGDYALTGTFYFTSIPNDTIRDYAMTALYTVRNAQAYHPDCSISVTGTSPITNCGNLNDANAMGWVMDPAPPVSGWCWLNYSNYHYGTASCPGASASKKGRIWVR